jgi:hypothetical protein
LTEADEWAEFQRARNRVLTLYIATTVLLLIGVGALALYSFQLGTLVGPGVESSFGLAVGLMFVMGALIVHLVDRMYREWPLGRRYTPTAPGPVTELGWAHLIVVIILVVAGGAIAYVLGGLLA